MRALRESLHGEPVRARARHHQRHDELHPHPDDRRRRGRWRRPTTSTALTEAQQLGYAERDPTADVEGFDAGAKAAIIATVAFGAKVVAGDVYHEGISKITGVGDRHRPPPRLRREVARDRRADRRQRRDQRARPPDDGAAPPSARRRPRQLQRGVRRGRLRRLAHVLRPRRRRRADRERGVRRRRRRGAQPARRHPRLARHAHHRHGATDRRDPRRVPPRPRRRRPSRACSTR